MQGKTPYLTFVIICYNKDYQNALKNIHSILKSHIPFEYEILAVYNRSGDFQKEAESKFFEEIKKLKNTHSLLITDAKNQYFCRSSALKFINSKYTWFVDGDDSILKIPRKFKNLDYDIVCFNAKTSDGGQWCFGPKREITNPCYDSVSRTINFTLWNKWIKTDILKGYIASNEKIVSGEDSLYCIYSLLNAKSIKYFDDILYSYSKPLQLYSPNAMNIERFEYLLTGNNHLLNELKNNISEQEIKDFGYDILEINELAWYLRAIENFKEIEEIKKASKFLLSNFSSKKLIAAFERLPLEYHYLIKRLEYNGIKIEY